MDVRELTDPEPRWLSIVDAGANRKKWKILKHQDGGAMGGETDLSAAQHADLVTHLEARKGALDRLIGLVTKTMRVGGGADPVPQTRRTVGVEGTMRTDSPGGHFDSGPAGSSLASLAMNQISSQGLSPVDVHTIVFDATRFSEQTAQKWAAEAGFDVIDVEVLDGAVQVQARDDDGGSGEFVAVPLAAGVQAVLCAPTGARKIDAMLASTKRALLASVRGGQALTTEKAEGIFREVLTGGGAGGVADMGALDDLKTSVEKLGTDIRGEISGLAGRLDVVEKAKAAPVDPNEAKEPDNMPAKKAAEEAALKTAQDLATKAAEDVIGKAVAPIAAAVEKMSGELKGELQGLGERVAKIEGTVQVRKGAAETRVLEGRETARKGGAMFDSAFPWGRRAAGE